MTKWKQITCFAFLMLACTIGENIAQDQNSKPGDQDYKLKVDVDLVNINVAVTTASGTYLADLKKDNFKVFEDKVEQRITNFSPVDAPFAVALVLDTSSSTEGKLARIQDEAIHFVQQLHPDDEVMVISFDDEVHLETGFTQNHNAIERAIKRTRTGQSTQLYEAVYLALQEKLMKRRERKAMVLFTDGVDTTSPTTSAKETIEKAKEADALIYTIFFDTRNDMRRLSRGGYPGTTNPRFPMPGRVPIDTRGPRQRDQDQWEIESLYQRGRGYLHDLAEATGGSFYDAGMLDTLGDAFAKIAHELRSLYSIGYVSTNQKKDGKFRKLLIKVDQPGTIVKAKKGYYPPKK